MINVMNERKKSLFWDLIEKDTQLKSKPLMNAYVSSFIVLFVSSSVLIWALLAPMNTVSYENAHEALLLILLIVGTGTVVLELLKPLRLLHSIHQIRAGQLKGNLELKGRLVRIIIIGVVIFGFFVVDVKYFMGRNWFRFTPAVSLVIFHYIRTIFDQIILSRRNK